MTSNFLRFCRDTEDKSTTILLVGNNRIIQPLSSSIIQANSTEKVISKLKVHKCETVKQVLLYGKDCVHVDFIAFCLNSDSSKDLKQIEEDMAILSNVFLLGRTCLILGLYGGVASSDTQSIVTFSSKYQLHQLNGKINDEECCLQLATRLLRLVLYSCGLVTGYPVVEKPCISDIDCDEESPSINNLSISVISGDDNSTSVIDSR